MGTLNVFLFVFCLSVEKVCVNGLKGAGHFCPDVFIEAGSVGLAGIERNRVSNSSSDIGVIFTFDFVLCLLFVAMYCEGFFLYHPRWCYYVLKPFRKLIQVFEFY